MKTLAIAAIILTACSAALPDKRSTAAPADGGTPPAALARPTRGAAPTPAALPADVVAFRHRRDACDELRGEEPYNAARAAQLNRLVRKACTGTDAALAALKAKYRGDAAVGAALAGYEERVE